MLQFLIISGRRSLSTLLSRNQTLASNTVHSESIQTPWLFPHFITLQPYSEIDSRIFAMRMEIELRCILFRLTILEMFLQLDCSPLVVNVIDWTWFGKAHTCLHKIPQLKV
jgi:hypothetical protein